jgi:uncharacterized protein YbaR (Trm112 family)
MPLDPRLLEILCCPSTHVRVVEMTAAEIETVNARIARGELHYADGTRVDEPLREALVTEDRRRIFRVDDEIPVMLAERAIETGS